MSAKSKNPAEAQAFLKYPLFPGSPGGGRGTEPGFFSASSPADTSSSDRQKKSAEPGGAAKSAACRSSTLVTTSWEDADVEHWIWEFIALT